MIEPASAVVRIELSSPRSSVFIASLAPLEVLLAQAGETGAMIESILQDKPRLFSFLSTKAIRLRELLHQEGHAILPVLFVEKLKLEIDARTCLGSPTLLQALQNFDEVCLVLDQCRMNNKLSIDTYHRNLREVEGSVHHAFHRLENALRRRLGQL